MSTLMSTDMNINRPSTRVRNAPGGNSTMGGMLGGGSENNVTVKAPVAAPVMATAAHVIEAVTVVDVPQTKKMDYLTVTSSSKMVGIALAASVGAEEVTTNIAKALATKGITNVVISLVENPSILSFVAKKLTASCSVVLAIGVLPGSTDVQSLSDSLIQTGLLNDCAVIPGVITASSLLELKATLPNLCVAWASSVASALALKSGSPVYIPVTAIVPSEVLAAAAIPRVAITAATSCPLSILDDFRVSLKSFGANGLAGIARSFRIMDDDNSGSLDYSEFNKAVIEHKLTWTPAQTKLMFDHFDIDKNGTISYEEFVRSVRGPLNDKRKQFVMQAFQLLDKDKSGIIEVNDLVGVYDGSKHPDVLSGRCTNEEILRQFLDTFDGAAKDGKCTPEEFINYYSNVSASIDSDDYFELMMRNAWHISGGEGWCENSSNRRVLVTHADGRLTVEEIKNDLGMKKDDKAAMMTNLKAQGIMDVVDIDLNGSFDNTTAPTKAAPTKGSGAGGHHVQEGDKPRPSTASSVNNPRRAPGGASSLILG